MTIRPVEDRLGGMPAEIRSLARPHSRWDSLRVIMRWPAELQLGDREAQRTLLVGLEVSGMDLGFIPESDRTAAAAAAP
jgi:hypothetical protein